LVVVIAVKGGGVAEVNEPFIGVGWWGLAGVRGTSY
jgi:hypothetical protein